MAAPKKKTESVVDVMNTLKQDMESGSFQRAYLLFGEEEYLLKQSFEKLKKAILPEDDGMSSSYYFGTKIDVNQVINDLRTLPFFTPHRLIIVEDSGFFKNANEELAEAVTAMPEENIIIFREREVDKRGKLYKTVSKEGVGRACDFSKLDEKMLISWLTQLLSVMKNGDETLEFQIERSVPQKLVEAAGTDMSALAIEAEKLKCHAMESGKITAADVDALVTSQVEDKIFDMCEAIAARNEAKAIDLYNDLMLLREAPMKIISLIARQYNIMLQIYFMKHGSDAPFDRYGFTAYRGGADNSTVAKYAKIPPFAVGKYGGQADKYDYHSLLEKYNLCLDASQKIKTGIMTDKTALENLIIRLL